MYMVVIDLESNYSRGQAYRVIKQYNKLAKYFHVKAMPSAISQQVTTYCIAIIIF